MMIIQMILKLIFKEDKNKEKIKEFHELGNIINKAIENGEI